MYSEHEHACGHEHSHIHSNDGEHGHTHGGDNLPAGNPQQMEAVLDYMLQHNIHHAEELHKLSHALEDAGMKAAASALHESTELFGQGNEKLSLALELVKKGE